MIEVIGWSGSLLYLYSQIYLSVLNGSKSRYATINMIASLIVVLYSFIISSYQPVAINLTWFALSFIYSKNLLPSPNKKTVKDLIFISFLVTIIISYFILYHYSRNVIYSMSWISFMVYSGSYFMYLFTDLSKNYFFIFSMLAPALLMPELIEVGNYPVVAIQTMWLVTSLVGIIKEKTHYKKNTNLNN